MNNTLKIIIIIALIWFVFRIFNKKSSDRTANANPYPWGGGSSGVNSDGGDNVSIPETWADVSPAVTECIGGKVHKRQVSNKSNYRWFATSADCQISVPQNTNLKSLPDYPKPTVKNREVFNDFPEFNLPANIVSVGGYSFPIFKDTAIGANGKIKLLSQGFTAICNIDGIPRAKWAENIGGQWKSNAYYYFQHLKHMATEAAKAMVSSSQNSGQWGDLQRFIDTGDYTGVTTTGATEMGRRMVGSARSIDDMNWNINTHGSVLMLDEETMGQYEWAGGSHYDFMGYVCKGISERSGDKSKTLLYGKPISSWLNVNHYKVHNNELTDAQLMEFINPNNMTTGGAWNGHTWYIDATGGYFKVPFMSGISLYQRDGSGNFIIENGKRKFRTSNDSINIFLSNNITIYGTPHDSIKWHGYRADGTWFEGWQSTWGAYNSKNMANQLPAGWEWGDAANPNPAKWQSEYQYFQNNAYTKADGIMQDLLFAKKKESGTYDISQPNEKYFIYSEHRPRTEPWTPYGNDKNSREIGDGFIFYDTFLMLYSGAKGLSTWDDEGRYKIELGYNGEPLWYDEQADYTKYHSRIAAIQEALKPLQGTDALTWKHIHFYYPYFGRKYSEVISSGVYHAGKLHIFFLNPTLEADEEQNMTLVIGAASHNIKLVGHEVYYQSFDAATGLSPEQFTLEYTTIYGKHTKVNGKVTNNRAEHYLIG
jgi:hypothetical protein